MGSLTLDRKVAADLGLIAMFAWAIACYMAVGSGTLADGDTGWHLAAGRWILDHGAAPRVDPFSYTFAGRPWLAHEWLSEAVMALAFAVAGWNGLMLLFGLAMASLFVVMGLELRRWLRPASLLGALGLTCVLIRPFLLDRPHILALPLLAVWAIGLMRAREMGRAPAWRLAAIMILWANLHGSFIFGLALIAPFAAEALLAAPPGGRLRAVRAWGMFGAIALVAALATPQGLEGLIFPFKVSNLAVDRLIGEWAPARFDHPTGFEIALLFAVLICLYRGVKVPVMRLLVLIGLLHLGLQHERHQAMLAVLGPLLLAEPLGRAFEPGLALPRYALGERAEGNWRALIPAGAVIGALFSVLVVRGLLSSTIRPDSHETPVSALSHVPTALRTEPVFNEYGFGGLLIFSGLRPYIDGRADMYGDDFTFDAVKIADGDQEKWRAAVARYGIRWTILPPGRGLVKVLDHDTGWRRVYADKWAVVHMAVAPPPAHPTIAPTPQFRSPVDYGPKKTPSSAPAGKFSAAGD